MFIEIQNENEIEEYYEMLQVMGALSRMFSDNTQPYIDYRVTENLFCMCLHAKNLSRSDCTADASKNNLGVGIKTFVNTTSHSSMQKVAEFNSKRGEYALLHPNDLIQKVANFRNERIEVTKRMHGLYDMIYHCIIRDSGKIHIIETPMDTINMDKIHLAATNRKNNVIYFTDNINEYSFNMSKSVLYKRFDTKNILHTLDVTILDNPYSLLRDLLSSKNHTISKPAAPKQPSIFLPLYSVKGGNKYVPEKSGLNQWNAGGRRRNENELYIPIPVEVHRKSPNFFPPRDVPFHLTLPDGKVLSAKVCQDNDKALMSNPNSELGRWLLRHILQIKNNEIVTYGMLSDLGIDSVIIYKIDHDNYTINFTSTGKYEQFVNDQP